MRIPTINAGARADTGNETLACDAAGGEARAGWHSVRGPRVGTAARQPHRPTWASRWQALADDVAHRRGAGRRRNVCGNTRRFRARSIAAASTAGAPTTTRRTWSPTAWRWCSCNAPGSAWVVSWCVWPRPTRSPAGAGAPAGWPTTSRQDPRRRGGQRRWRLAAAHPARVAVPGVHGRKRAARSAHHAARAVGARVAAVGRGQPGAGAGGSRFRASPRTSPKWTCRTRSSARCCRRWG